MPGAYDLAYKDLKEVKVLTAPTGTEQTLVYSLEYNSAFRVPASSAKPIPFRFDFTLSSSQILALTTTPVAVYTSPLADRNLRAYIVTYAKLDTVGPFTTAYTVPANCTYALRITNTSGDLLTTSVGLTGFMDQTSTRERILTTPIAGFGPQDASNPIVIHQNAGTALTLGTCGLRVRGIGFTFLKDF